MALKSCSHVATWDCLSDLNVSRYLRDIPPAHYTLMIDSYSQFLQALSKSGHICYTSHKFEAAGYKWKLCLYPNGDEERNGKGYISMFLTIQDTESLPLGWEVNVIYKFFVFDHIRNNYLSIQDASGRISRFDARKTEYGISQLLPLCDFNDSEKGFLIQDKCNLGAEICVVRCTHDGEYISSVKNFELYSYKWEVSSFSSKTQKMYCCDIFTAGGFKWQLVYYPKGHKSGEGNSLSFYFGTVDLKATDRVYAEYKLSVHDQCSGKHEELEELDWFTPSNEGWVYTKFLSLEDLHNPSKGFVIKDKVIFEVQITNIVAVQRL